MDAYFLAKALHLVSVVSWFAGLFYLGRIFIYHAEALRRPEAESSVLVPQFTLMEGRVWKAIIAPAGFAALLTGVWLMVLTKAWQFPWFHLKLALLVLLFIYHGASNRFRLDFETGKARTVRFFRFWNEGATVLLFLIVFVAAFKSIVAAGYGLLVVAILIGIGMAVFLWKRRGAPQ